MTGWLRVNSLCSIQSFRMLATFLAPEYDDSEDVLTILPWYSTLPDLSWA